MRVEIRAPPAKLTRNGPHGLESVSRQTIETWPHLARDSVPPWRSVADLASLRSESFHLPFCISALSTFGPASALPSNLARL
jgi:hypothetical protein